jgi:glutathione peroxidase
MKLAVSMIITRGMLVCAPTVFAQPMKETPMTIYDFTVKTIDDQDKSLSDYKGKVLLIVNTASRCGFTPQYQGLEEIYQQFKDKGFEILAFPSNDFMGQEPGTNSEIKNFCSLKYKVTFPLFAKTSVKGSKMSALYEYLTTQSGFNGEISWNFNKFLVDQQGKVIARYGSPTSPTSKEVVDQINKLLQAG